jgi:hypothetical protein
MTTASDDYEEMFGLTPYPWCWACGRNERQKPTWWWAGWRIERAHIVRAPRVKNVRAVVLLCPQCHGINHGHRFFGVGIPLSMDEQRRVLNRLDLRHLLWLKRHFDPRLYDRKFLREHHFGALPRAAKPMAYFEIEYNKRRGGYPHLGEVHGGTHNLPGN